MSRIGQQPIKLPQGIKLELKEDNLVSVQGPKGVLEYKFPRHGAKFELKEKELVVKKEEKNPNAAAMWGTARAIINNMVKGVTEGFEKKLELNGVGFKMSLQGNKLVLNLGFSHEVVRELPEGIEAEIEKNILAISGIDKQRVGQFAAEIRGLKKAEPYKGKGFRYIDEQIIRKEGKKAVAAE